MDEFNRIRTISEELNKDDLSHFDELLSILSTVNNATLLYGQAVGGAIGCEVLKRYREGQVTKGKKEVEAKREERDREIKAFKHQGGSSGGDPVRLENPDVLKAAAANASVVDQLQIRRN